MLLVRHLDEARCTLTPSDPSSAVGGSVVQAASEPAELARRVWPLLLRAWGRRPLPAAVEQQRAEAAAAAAAQRSESRAETAASLVHGADTLLRQLVARTMAQAKQQPSPPPSVPRTSHPIRIRHGN